MNNGMLLNSTQMRSEAESCQKWKYRLGTVCREFFVLSGVNKLAVREFRAQLSAADFFIGENNDFIIDSMNFTGEILLKIHTAYPLLCKEHIRWLNVLAESRIGLKANDLSKE